MTGREMDICDPKIDPYNQAKALREENAKLQAELEQLQRMIEAARKAGYVDQDQISTERPGH